MKKTLLCLLLTGLAAADLPPSGLWKVRENYAGPTDATWRFLPATRTFEARGRAGDALLRLESFDGNHIVITRQETTGPTAGLNVRYEGFKTADGFAGQVIWSWQDQARRGTWSATLPPTQPVKP